jgi:hypothetical protein
MVCNLANDQIHKMEIKAVENVKTVDIVELKSE